MSWTPPTSYPHDTHCFCGTRGHCNIYPFSRLFAICFDEGSAASLCILWEAPIHQLIKAAWSKSCYDTRHVNCLDKASNNYTSSPHCLAKPWGTLGVTSMSIHKRKKTKVWLVRVYCVGVVSKPFYHYGINTLQYGSDTTICQLNPLSLH